MMCRARTTEYAVTAPGSPIAPLELSPDFSRDHIAAGARRRAGDARPAAGAAAQGRGGCVLVRGPAGIGKTALLAEARTLAAGAGLRVLAARGSELERSFAFGAVQQLFARSHARPRRRRRARGRGVLRRGARAQPGGAARALLAGRRPRAAGDRRRRRPLARPPVAALARLHAQPRGGAPAGARAGRARRASRRAAAGHPPPPRDARPQPRAAVRRRRAPARRGGARPRARRRVRARRGGGDPGNPFYLRALLAEGGTPRRGGRPRRAPARPAARRTCARLARALAVLDGAASGTVAARLAGLDVRDTVEAAEALAAADLVRDGAFVHPLVRSAVYAAIPAAERTELHARAARLLADADAPPERVAAQLAAGEPGAGEWAVEALRRAARAAWARGAPDVAARFLQRARAEDMPPAPAGRRAARARARRDRRRRPRRLPLPVRGARAGRPGARRGRARAGPRAVHPGLLQRGPGHPRARAGAARGPRHGRAARPGALRRLGGLERSSRRAPERRPARGSRWRASRPRTAPGARRPRWPGRSRTRAGRRADGAHRRGPPGGGRGRVDRAWPKPPARRARSSGCASPSRCARCRGSGSAASPPSRPTCAS